MKKVLVVDESSLFRNFIKAKLESYGFEVAQAINGLDGVVKLRQESPDLLVMDFFLSRQSSLELLKKKKSDPNTAKIPVIMVSNKIDRQQIVQVGQYDVKKFFTKPIKVDAFLKTVSELLDVPLDIDNTPCIIEAHFNDEILFIEIAQGLNKEKIELLKYKISELMELYKVKVPKVLVMMSSLEIDQGDALKLGTLLSNIVEHSKAKGKFIKVLTNSDFVKKYIAGRKDYADIEVTHSLETAMDGLLGRKAGAYIDQDNNVVQQEFLTARNPKNGGAESIQMRFDSEVQATNTFDLNDLGEDIKIITVDDDLVIQELIKTAFSETKLNVVSFDNGRDFTDNWEDVKDASLMFLDLMMPEMDGFQTLSHMKKNDMNIPVIIMSALSKRETVIKALNFGVNSYLIKPIKPEGILQKAVEVLKMNF